MLAIALLLGILALYLGPQFLRIVGQRRLERLSSERGALVLTYDDGPGERITAPLIELLDRHGARATFFLLGMRAAKHPELADLVASRGHELGCHTERHLHAWKQAPWTIFDDVDRGFRTLSRWLPQNAIFRPTYGKLTLANWLPAYLRGASMGWWTVDSGDSHDRPPDVMTAARLVHENGGGVVLLHDCDRDDETNAFVLRATEALLDQAKTDGLSVMTLGELLSPTDRPEREAQR